MLQLMHGTMVVLQLTQDCGRVAAHARGCGRVAAHARDCGRVAAHARACGRVAAHARDFVSKLIKLQLLYDHQV